jgi:hypothetical protein
VRLGLETESTGKITSGSLVLVLMTGLNVFSEHNSNTLVFCRGLRTVRYDSLTLGYEPNKEITDTPQFLLGIGIPRQNKLSWLTNGFPPPTNFLDIRNVSPVSCYILKFRINTIQILQIDCLETRNLTVQFLFNFIHSQIFLAVPKICVELLRK